MMYEMEWMRNEKMEYSSSSMRRLFKVVQATNGSSDDDSNNDNEYIENNNMNMPTRHLFPIYSICVLCVCWGA